MAAFYPEQESHTRVVRPCGNIGSNAVEAARHWTDRGPGPSDTGQGITAEQIPGIFERFGDGHASTSQGGLGLGLAIVRHLVGLHGGNVQAANAGVGQGATSAKPIDQPSSPPRSLR